jgi:hypothetical protein
LRGIQWTVSLFLPFQALLDRFDFDCFHQELVTRYFQSISDFCFEARYSRAAKAIFRLANELLSIGAVRGATALVKVYRDIPKHRSSYRNNQVSEMLISFCNCLNVHFIISSDDEAIGRIRFTLNQQTESLLVWWHHHN